MGKAETLEEVLDGLVVDDEDGDSVTVETMLSRIESRGFGPVLLLPGLVAFLPTGAITTVPSLCGLTTFLTAIQMALGRRHPWVPRRIREVEVSREQIDSWVERLRSTAQWLDRFFEPRLKFLSRSPWDRVVAFLSAFVGLTMIPLEIIPWACTLPAAALLLASVGLITRDGVLVLLALGTYVGSFYLTYLQFAS